MLDLSFGLPIVVRDAALKMVAPGPNSDINREYYAQEHEKDIEEGRGAIEAYEKTDDKARELLRRLANSEPYYKKQRRIEAAKAEGGQESASAATGSGAEVAKHTPGPVRPRDSKLAGAAAARAGKKGGKQFPGTAQLPPQPKDWLPPHDPNITALFVTGVEDDLPEHELRTFFSKFGQIRSLICSHRSHCAFVNYTSREVAEAAAAACEGRAIIKGVPLRVRWGKPKPLDTMEREERMANAKEGRETMKAIRVAGGDAGGLTAGPAGAAAIAPAADDLDSLGDLAPPPGQEEVQYASLAGN